MSTRGLSINKRRWSFLLILLTLFPYLENTKADVKTYNASSGDFSQKLCRIQMGWESWRPYQYLDSEGNIAGIHIELIKLIASKAGCHLDFVQNRFVNSIKYVRDGTLDMVSNTTITAERKKFALFTIPYRKEMIVLYVSKEKLALCKQNSFSQLIQKGFRFGVPRGNLYGEEINQIQKQPRFARKIVYLESNRKGLSALLQGKIDGYFNDPAVHAYYLKREHLKGEVKPCKVTVYAEDVSLMFSKSTVTPDIILRFNKAMIEIQKSEYYRTHWN